MAWNSRETKSLNSMGAKAANLGPGSPVANNPNFAGRGYRDSWDIERAYREGMQKVTWVNRCIDAISGNQARLPVILRKDNDPEGEIISRKHELLNILNSKANEGENSFIFRYRMSSQLLMSSRGVFIEKIRGRSGKIIALNLLPPQHTSPIPHPKKFVSGYEVLMPHGEKVIVPKEDVVWIRRPHPIDPYLSLTPMESAGIAIEIENLSKLYNRNFLLNDGRPGGLLVLRSEIDEDDKDELRSRFRGNINRAGSVTVISSDDGADYIDTASNPRDANYVEMRQIQKEEILAAFGVPESVIGNAAGRTFNNAAEELRVFWMETMMPHLEQIARGLDELDDKYYIDFETGQIPILIIAKQERERYSMEEFQTGLISMNEYRKFTGRKTVESELADSLLISPNLAPVANTEKPFDTGQVQPVDMGATGAPGQEGVPGQEGAQPPGLPMIGAEQGAPPGQEGAPAGPTDQVAPGAEPGPDVQAPASEAPGQLSAWTPGIQVKTENQALDEWEVKSEQATNRWTEIVDSALERFFERQQRVITEKALGAKARRLMQTRELKVDDIFDLSVWNRQLVDDLAPLLSGVASEAAEISFKDENYVEKLEIAELKSLAEQQIERIKKTNETTKEEVAAALLVAMAMNPEQEEEKQSILKAALAAIFANLLNKRKRIIAEHETQSAFNAGVFLAGQQMGKSSKTWLTRRDSNVRTAHRTLHGKSVPLSKGFSTDGSVLRFPGDPLAPPHLTINCRCRLRYS
jgi:HK97 family phage portal protein